MSADIFDSLFSLVEFSAEKLVSFAKNDHGYVGDDGAYSVTYFSDLDEFEKAHEMRDIPEGMVEIACYGQDSVLVSETDYLHALQRYLENGGQPKLAQEIQRLSLLKND